MSGSFSSINTALSALRYNQVGMDVAASNISNVGTEGYTRRRVEASAVGAPTQPALWSRSDGYGGGVEVSSIRRMSDALLTARSRSEHTLQSYLSTRATILARFEAGIGEPSDQGLSSVLIDFRKSWYDLANAPDSDAARGQVLNRAVELTATLSGQVRNIDSEASDQRLTALDRVTEINTLLTDLAATNRSISTARAGGSDPSLLHDQRDMMALRLAQLTGAQTTIAVDGSAQVELNGTSLVAGSHAGSVQITGGITPGGDATGGPVTLQATAAITGLTAPLALGQQGELAAIVETLNVTLPGYRSDLGAMAAGLADAVNAAHAAGYDVDGNPGEPLFTYDPADPAGTLSVLITDSRLLAASSLPGGAVDGENANKLGMLGGAEKDYQRIVNSFGSQVSSLKRLEASQSVLTRQVDGAREQLAGVSLDEEMTHLVAFQRGYEAAARVITVIDSILDTLINRTGLLR